MKEEDYTAEESHVKFVRPPWTPPKRTPEEIAERIAWLDQWFEDMKELDKTEPLPDNFIEICKGKAWPPVYSKANTP
jgi:hypothetical protein